MASLIPMGVSLGAKLLGGLFGGKSKKKQEEAANKAAIGAAELKNTMAEDKRLANLSAGQSILGQLAGRGFTNIDPATAAKLGERRTYDFSKAVAPAGAGQGSSLLSGLFGLAGDVADQYAANQQDNPHTMSAAPGGIATQEIVPFDPKLGRGMSFGSGTQNFG